VGRSGASLVVDFSTLWRRFRVDFDELDESFDAEAGMG
jgi:hypothetical protein